MSDQPTGIPLRVVDGRYQMLIGDTWYEFPAGTTIEHVHEVFEAAKQKIRDWGEAGPPKGEN